MLPAVPPLPLAAAAAGGRANEGALAGPPNRPITVSKDMVMVEPAPAAVAAPVDGGDHFTMGKTYKTVSKANSTTQRLCGSTRIKGSVELLCRRAFSCLWSSK